VTVSASHGCNSLVESINNGPLLAVHCHQDSYGGRGVLLLVTVKIEMAAGALAQLGGSILQVASQRRARTRNCEVADD
jgi:hypothetical protein